MDEAPSNLDVSPDKYRLGTKALMLPTEACHFLILGFEDKVDPTCKQGSGCTITVVRSDLLEARSMFLRSIYATRLASTSEGDSILS